VKSVSAIQAAQSKKLQICKDTKKTAGTICTSGFCIHSVILQLIMIHLKSTKFKKITIEALPHVVGLLLTIYFIIESITKNSESFLQSPQALFTISILSSYIFYLYVIYIPTTLRRRMIKHNFDAQLKNFKISLITEFLSIVMQSDDTQKCNPEDLLDITQFSSFFNAPYTQDQTRWEKITESIESGAYDMKFMRNELKILNDEIHFILNNIEINDAWVFLFLKKLTQTIYSIKAHGGSTHNVSAFLWQIFAGWSSSNLHTAFDPFTELSQRI
jgi:hypothetical protein